MNTRMAVTCLATRKAMGWSPSVYGIKSSPRSRALTICLVLSGQHERLVGAATQASLRWVSGLNEYRRGLRAVAPLAVREPAQFRGREIKVEINIHSIEFHLRARRQLQRIGRISCVSCPVRWFTTYHNWVLCQIPCLLVLRKRRNLIRSHNG